MFLIGVRYCGGCDPKIDRSGIVRELQERLREAGLEVGFVSGKDGNRDMLLLVNGCMHACLEEEYVGGQKIPPFVSVKGEMVDDQYVREGQIPEMLTRKVVEWISGLERGESRGSHF